MLPPASDYNWLFLMQPCLTHNERTIGTMGLTPSLYDDRNGTLEDAHQNTRLTKSMPHRTLAPFREDDGSFVRSLP